MSNQTRNLKRFYLLSLLAAVFFLSIFLSKKDLYMFNKHKDVKQAEVEVLTEEKSENTNWFGTKIGEEKEEGKANNTKIIKRIIGLL